jgi:regulator of replication initiation timing
MQDQENDNFSPESSEDPATGLKAESLEISPEPEVISDADQVASVEADSALPKEESRSRRFFRKVIRWTAGLLVIFGLGFLAAIFTIYTPKVDELDQSKRDLDQAGSTITGLEDQIAALQDQIDGLDGQIDTLNQKITDLETQNQALLAEQAGFNLHIALLKTRADVVSAQVELFDQNPAQARILLANTDQNLATIESLLPDDLKDVVTPLQTRLELAINEIDTDPETAIDDLGILAGDLLEIENALFSE